MGEPLSETRDELFAKFIAETPAEFRGLAQPPYGPFRIIAPAHATFQGDGPNAHYLDAYIDAVWQQYANQDLVIDLRNGWAPFTGRVVDGRFRFTDGPYWINGKPSTSMAMLGNGLLDDKSGASNADKQLQLQAQVCAALNRQVAHLPFGQWWNGNAFYPAGRPANAFAKFWHDPQRAGAGLRLRLRRRRRLQPLDPHRGAGVGDLHDRVVSVAPRRLGLWAAAAAAALAAGGLGLGLRHQPPAPVPAPSPGLAAAVPAPSAPAGLRTDTAPAPPAVLAFALTALGRSPDGRPFAWISAGGAPPRRHAVGDSVALGVRLASIGSREAVLERGAQRERLLLPAGLPALPPPVAHATEPARWDDPQGVIARPADAPLPSSTPIERAIRRAGGAAPG